MSTIPIENPAADLDPGPYRAMSREYFTTMRQSYERDKATRSAQSFGFFGIAGLVMYRYANNLDFLYEAMAGQTWIVPAVMGVIGLFAGGLTWLIFRMPSLRMACIVIGGILLAVALAAYAGMAGVYPSAITDRLSQNGSADAAYFQAGGALTIVGLAFLIPVASATLREVPEPTDAMIEERALMLAAQARKAEEIRAAQASGEAPASGYSRRRRR